MTKPITQEEASKTLRLWAMHGEAVLIAQSKQPVDWAPVQAFIKAVQPVLKLEQERLSDLLDKSKKILRPFDDPLRINLGAHRWLKSEREEAYSDWLGWIVEQIETSSLIFPVFGLQDKESSKLYPGAATAGREKSIPGTDSGRTDLELRFDENEAILVEVKNVDIDSIPKEQLKEQLEKYANALPKFKHRVLLAPSGQQASYAANFKLRRWQDVCMELRRIVPILCKDSRMIQAAMILAFVGAVEQNLLDFPGDLDRVLGNSQPVSSLIREHLKKATTGDFT